MGGRALGASSISELAAISLVSDGYLGAESDIFWRLLPWSMNLDALELNWQAQTRYKCQINQEDPSRALETPDLYLRAYTLMGYLFWAHQGLDP